MLLRLLSKFLGIPMGVLRVFERLFTEFVSGQVICLAVGSSGSRVRVGCQVVQFSCSVVRALGHSVLLACSMRSETVRIIEMIDRNRDHGA